MPVHGTTWRPVCSATRRENRTSRPPNIAVGSPIVLMPRSTAALAASTAAWYAPSSSTGTGGSDSLTVPACGHSARTASSRKIRCSWMRVVPSSSASIGPATVSTFMTNGGLRRLTAPA